MVFQGTVLPMLWNIFCADISAFITHIVHQDERFADNLGVFKAFGKDIDNATVLEKFHACQEAVHDWGRAHQMTFDNTKLLGLIVDPKLTMHTAVQKVIGQARGKVTALLRTIHLYNVKTIVNQYTCHSAYP